MGIAKCLTRVGFSVCAKTFTQQLLKSWETTHRASSSGTELDLGVSCPLIKFQLFSAMTGLQLENEFKENLT